MTSTAPFFFMIILELGGLGLVLFQHRWLDGRNASRSGWALLGLAITFGSGFLLASLALMTATAQFTESAISLAAMSIGASQFGFALYHIRPASRLLSKPPFGPVWKQLAALSYSAFIAGFVLFSMWADFVLE